MDPVVARVFQGVNHIIHVGDVCRPPIIAELEEIAPVTVALGNNDSTPAWRETELFERDGLRVLARHILTPERPGESMLRRIESARPHAVVYGHTHQADARVLSGILFLNPGFAGHPERGASRGVALLEWENGKLQWKLVPL